MLFSKAIVKPDGKRSRVARYRVISKSGNVITARMQGETRKGKDGKLIVWDLIVESPNKYVWHRGDWDDGMITPAVERCQ